MDLGAKLLLRSQNRSIQISDIFSQNSGRMNVPIFQRLGQMRSDALMDNLKYEWNYNELVRIKRLKLTFKVVSTMTSKELKNRSHKTWVCCRMAWISTSDIDRSSSGSWSSNLSSATITAWETNHWWDQRRREGKSEPHLGIVNDLWKRKDPLVGHDNRQASSLQSLYESKWPQSTSPWNKTKGWILQKFIIVPSGREKPLISRE